MKFLLEDWILVNGLELGLEVTKSLGAAIGTTTGIGKGVTIIVHLGTRFSPVEEPLVRKKPFDVN